MSQRLTYIEIDLEGCANIYGEAPCTAAIGVTGDAKCFNTRKTCQDIVNFAPITNTLRLAKPSYHNPGGTDAVDNVESVSYTPSIIKLGESIGTRSTLTIVCNDHPSPDTGVGGDPYVSERPYNAYEQGTYWGKFKARYPFLRGKMVRWINGRVGQTIEQMETRTFIVDRVEGVSTNGKFRIVCKDPLTLLDDKRAQAPVLSRGVLNSAVTESATSLTLSPVGIGNEDYPASGKVAIGGNEIVSFTRSGDVMTITRAQDNTEAQEHDEDDRVQLVLSYTAQDPADIIYDLVTNYASVPTSFINLGNWQAETAEFLGRAYTGIIAEPASVKDLINEILEQAALSLWWDEVNATMRLQVLRDITQGTFVYNDDVIMAGSFNQKDQPAKRVSQVWSYFGQINPLESQDNPKNYRNTLLTANLVSEENWGEPAIKRIYSRWITQFGRTAAERLNNLILSRYSEPPKMYSFKLLRDSGTPLPSLGGGFRVESFFNQDAFGLPVTSPSQATSIQVDDATLTVSAEEVIISESVEPDDPTVKIVPIDTDTNNFNFRTAFLETYTEANSGDTVICEVRSGVIVGSESTSLPAWRTGTGWPAGVSLELRILSGAYIVGKGGNGGSASITSNAPLRVAATNGGSGGAAIAINSSITINNDGVIGSGAGGSGGAISAGRLANGQAVCSAIGGSGGAGFFSGAGGSASISGLSSSNGPTIADVKNGISGTLSSGGGGQSANASRSISGPFGQSTVNTSASTGSGGGLGVSAGASTASASGNGIQLVSAQGSGGQPGNAVEGDSLITWAQLGDIRGARVG